MVEIKDKFEKFKTLQENELSHTKDAVWKSSIWKGRNNSTRYKQAIDNYDKQGVFLLCLIFDRAFCLHFLNPILFIDHLGNEQDRIRN